MTVRIPLGRVIHAALLLCGRPEAQARIAAEGRAAYELRVYGTCMHLATAFEDIEHAINLLGRGRTFQEVRALLKAYFISWASLFDATANILNETMRLGLSERQVSWPSVIDMPLVKATRVPAIVAAHESALRREYFMRIRNDIVHRGWLVDVEFDEAHGEWLYVSTIAQIRNPKMPVEDTLRAAAVESGIHAKIAGLIRVKQQQLTQHLDATFKFLEELAPEIEEQLRPP